MLNVEQPPPPPLDTHFCGFPSLFGLMSQSRGLGVKAHGMHHGGYTASHTHGIADGTGSANGQRGSIHVEGAADCHFDFFFLTDTAIPLVSGAGTLPPSIHPVTSIFSFHSSSKSFLLFVSHETLCLPRHCPSGETPFTPP